MSVKFENRTNDDIIISFQNQQKTISVGDDFSFEAVEGKDFILKVERKRIPTEYTQPKAKKKFSIYEDGDKPASHVQLKSEFELEAISTHVVITVEESVSLFDTLHEDVLFSAYKLSFLGAKQKSQKDYFANEQVKRSYITTQVKSAVFPVGLVGIIVAVIGLYCLINALNGNLIKIFQNEVSNMSAGVLTVGGIAVTGVFVSNIIKIFKRVKALS